MKLLPLLLAPALALAGTYSGTVTLLDGTPVVGAVIKAGTDSVTSSTDGSWTLARASGIASRSGKTISVTSHLTLENRRPRLTFGGMDITGRTAHKPVTGQFPSNIAAARNQAASDTLRVYWKGKRLTVLPVPADTGNVTFKIDTAWKDDAGIPWNPRIAYGSLFDTRDSQTYRTVTIGTQTWMAENLNYKSKYSKSYGDDSSNSSIYGQLYGWDEATQGQGSFPTVQGLCPIKWHIPNSIEWQSLKAKIDSNSQPETETSGLILKSQKGWIATNANESDAYGFRALPAGEKDAFNHFWYLKLKAFFWTSNSDGYRFWGELLDNSSAMTHIDGQNESFSIRCLKDTP